MRFAIAPRLGAVLTCALLLLCGVNCGESVPRIGCHTRVSCGQPCPDTVVVTADDFVCSCDDGRATDTRLSDCVATEAR